VIGINTAVILPQKQTNGIGFAIPISDQLIAEIHQLKQGKEIVYGYLGVTVSDPTLHERNASGAKEGGAVIESIESKGPADGSKLKADDVITAVNGTPVRDSDSFIRIVGRAPIDQPARLTVARDRKTLEVSVAPRRRPMPAVAINRETQKLRWRGITLTAVPANWSAKEGVYIVAIEDAEAGKKLGIKQGQVITQFAGQRIKGIADLQKVIDSVPLDDVKLQTADTATIATAQP
jgi:S1-C subfamily serine protease